MAPDIVYEYLPIAREGQRFLDPMVGSGTSIAVARSRGYIAAGCDTDPLAVIIARVNSSDLNVAELRFYATKVWRSAYRQVKRLRSVNAYPSACDAETRLYIDYWFDRRSRIELRALTKAMEDVPSTVLDAMKCSFSRMIITKKRGVSLGEDVSHSRPHRTRLHPPVYPLDAFLPCVDAVVRSNGSNDWRGRPNASITSSDCRRLAFEDKSFDVVITSPPYLNAIDYLRGHKLSLVWLGHTVKQLREIRASNIGTERGLRCNDLDDIVERMVTSPTRPSEKLQNRLRRYVNDLNVTFSEIKRVARNGAKLIVVIGDCTIQGCDVRNSLAIETLAMRNGFTRTAAVIRELPSGHRYLPPPGRDGFSTNLERRMWNEIVFQFERI